MLDRSEFREIVIVLGVITVWFAIISGAILIAEPCKPGDRGWLIGDAMLMGGCPAHPIRWSR